MCLCVEAKGRVASVVRLGDGQSVREEFDDNFTGKWWAPIGVFRPVGLIVMKCRRINSPSFLGFVRVIF